MNQDQAVTVGWRAFVAEYWTRKPDQSGFFTPPPFDADALWKVALRAGDESRFMSPDGPIALDGSSYFPRPEDHGFDRYAQRLARVFPDGYLFQQSDLQAVDVAIYDWAREFLRDLFDALGGMPPARAWLETTFGHYATTPIGIQRGQPGGVFMFVLAGCKQTLVWPPGTEGLEEDTRSYDTVRPAAHEIEGCDGSACYWPGEWWHVGESPAGPSLSLQLTVQLLRGAEIGWDALGTADPTYTIDQRLAPTTAAAHELASAGYGRVLAKLNSPAAHQRAVEAHMRRLSAVCLQKVPAIGPRRRPEADEVIAVDPRFPILLAETAPGRMSCAANGQMFRIDSSPRLARLLDRLNTGEPADIRTLCAEFAASGTGSDPLDQGTLLGVLARLSAARALHTVSVSSPGSAG